MSKIYKNNHYIYIHICPNGKRYVGQSINPSKRWGSNGVKYKTNKHFYSAIKKYGWDNIEHIIMRVPTHTLMNFWEIVLIHHYKTNDISYGYNNSNGGEHNYGRIPWNKGLKGVQVAWNRGKSPSNDTRKKISEHNKGKHTWMKGRKLSDATRKKISEHNKGRKLSDATRKKMSESQQKRRQRDITPIETKDENKG